MLTYQLFEECAAAIKMKVSTHTQTQTQKRSNLISKTGDKQKRACKIFDFTFFIIFQKYTKFCKEYALTMVQGSQNSTSFYGFRTMKYFSSWNLLVFVSKKRQKLVSKILLFYYFLLLLKLNRYFFDQQTFFLQKNWNQFVISLLKNV